MIDAADGPDDRTLLAQMSQGDVEALKPFYERWHPSVRRVLFFRENDALDVVQLVADIFVRAWYDARRVNVDRISIENWLIAIARELCVERCRSE